MAKANHTSYSRKPDRIRVLLVEPNEESTTAVRRALEKSDSGDRSFDVVHHSDPDAALADVSGAVVPVDIAMLSATLSESSCLEFRKQICEKNASLPVVLLFDAGREKEAANALCFGADEVVIKDPDGGYLELLPDLLAKVAQHAARSASGTLSQLAVIVRSDPESTAYKRAEKRLLDSEPFWRAMVESPFELVVLVDKAGTIQYVNRAEHFEFSDLVGKESIYDFISPDQHESIQEKFDTVFRDGTSDHYEVYVPRVDKWFSSSIGPVYEGRRVIGASVFSRDITEQKLVENQLKESESRFRQLTKAIKEVFYILDPVKRETVYASPGYEEVYGRSLESVYSDPTSWMELLHPDDRDEVQDDFARMIRSKADGYRGHTHRIVKPDGSVRWLRNRAYVIRDDKGEPIQIAGVVTDVTATKEAEEKLQKAHEKLREAHDDLERRVEERTRELQATSEAFERSRRLASIGTLAAGIAHEINNPIGSILMAADMALLSLDDPKETEEVREALESVKEDAKRAGRIVKTVLQLSRQEVSQKWPRDIGDAACRARDLTRRVAESQGVTVEIEMEADLPMVMINPTEIEQAFVNVMSNAIEASQPGQSVAVRLDSDETHVRAVFDDSGQGMDREKISRAFDPFFSTRQSEGGTGLGLSLAHSIVHLHGGTIDIESEPGKGTRVTIGLPRADHQGGETVDRSHKG